MQSAALGDPTSLLNDAIARARTSLAALQREDGSFGCDTDIGPIGLGVQVIVESLFGVLTRADAEAANARFADLQLLDGSFPPYPGAEDGSVTVTALVWIATRACGAPNARAREWLDAHGGLPAVGRAFHEASDPAALYLVATGDLEASELPKMPPGIALLPLELMLERHVHAGNVMVALVMTALHGRYGGTRPSGFLGTTRHALEMTRVRQYLVSWQNEDGSWNGSPLQTGLILLGLHAAGMTASDPPAKRALAWLDSMKRRDARGLDVCAMDNDVWSTALCALALHVSAGVASHDEVARAQAHLLDTQTREPMPRANQRKRSAKRVGGWPFQRGNTTMPDTDDTGVVIAALATLAGDRAPREVFRAIDDGIAWLRDMQNPDGGFPTFVWGLPGKKPGPMFVADLPAKADASFLWAPPPELGDPALEGVTGRVLWGLGKAGITRDDPAVCRAVAFLIEQQCDSGAWWGRWKVCYVAETATILLGLAAVREDMTESYVRRAVDWIVAQQNVDGGFGEDPIAYRDPARAGRGQSMPPVTAYALLGLIAARAPAASIERAAAYLIAEQRSDGLWDNAGWLHTFIPPALLYTYEMPAIALPLLALAEYRRWRRR